MTAPIDTETKQLASEIFRDALANARDRITDKQQTETLAEWAIERARIFMEIAGASR